MRVVITETSAHVAQYAADLIAAEIRRRRAEGRSAVLGVATGSSPLGIYAKLAALVEAGELDTTGVSAFALDEYVGLDIDHPESYYSVVRTTVTEPLQLDPRNVHVPDGLASDIPAACDAYEQAIIDAGGIDLQLLGIGSNGHIGFNEPTSSLTSRTRMKTLDPRTREDNARFFASIDDVPVHCITQGLRTILDSRKAVLVAHGAGKADVVARMIEGPLASIHPASSLQLHRDAVVVLDRAAASDLTLADYYEYIEEHQPGRTG